MGLTFTSLSVPYRGIRKLQMVLSSWILWGLYLSPVHVSLSFQYTVELALSVFIYLFIYLKKWIFSPPLWYRSWTKAQAERRQQNVPCVVGPKPVSAGHDQQYSEWLRRPIWDVQHHHETQTKGEQFQGLHSTWDIRSVLAVHCIWVFYFQTLSSGLFNTTPVWCIAHIKLSWVLKL